MDGITVVNTIQGICGYGDGWTLGFGFLAFLGTAMAVLAIFVIYIMIADRDCADAGGIFMLLIAIGISILLWFGAYEQYHAKPIYGPQQVVLVDDDVPLNEFMDRYVIVAHEGELYTIYER